MILTKNSQNPHVTAPLTDAFEQHFTVELFLYLIISLNERTYQTGKL